MNKEKIIQILLEEGKVKSAADVSIRAAASGLYISIPGGGQIYGCNIFQSAACCAVAEVGNINISTKQVSPALMNVLIDYTCDLITNRSAMYINSNGQNGLELLEANLNLRPDFIKLPIHRNPNTKRRIAQYFTVLRNRM